jgi:hypothetical protein
MAHHSVHSPLLHPLGNTITKQIKLDSNHLIFYCSLEMASFAIMVKGDGAPD